MVRPIAAAALVLMATPILAAELPPNELIDWSGEGGSEQVFTAADITATLTLSGDESERTATLEIVVTGSEPATVSGLGAGNGFGQIGVVEFDENGGRSIIFAVYGGGAHCCMQAFAVTETGQGFVVSEIGSVDGDAITAVDIDGDGSYEIPLRDDRFNYSFDAFALSFAPPLVMKSKDGAVYDASDDPRFRSYFEAALEDARPSCSGDTFELGVCAGILAIAARLGTYDVEAPPILAAIAAGKTTSGWEEFSFSSCSNDDCTESPAFTSFAEALDYALRAWGYLPA